MPWLSLAHAECLWAKPGSLTPIEQILDKLGARAEIDFGVDRKLRGWEDHWSWESSGFKSRVPAVTVTVPSSWLWLRGEVCPASHLGQTHGSGLTYCWLWYSTSHGSHLALRGC